MRVMRMNSTTIHGVTSGAGDIPKWVWDADQVPYRTYDTVLSTGYYPVTFEEEVEEVEVEETPWGYIIVDWGAFAAGEDGSWDAQTTESLTLEQLLARMDENIQSAIDYASDAKGSDYGGSVLALIENTLKYMITGASWTATAGGTTYDAGWTSDMEKPSVEHAINYALGWIQSVQGVDFGEGEGVFDSTEAAVQIITVLADFWLNYDVVDSGVFSGWYHMPEHFYNTYDWEMGSRDD